MNYLKILFVILFFILTACAVKFKTELHQPMLIENAEFSITEMPENIPQTTIVGNNVQQNLPQQEVTSKKVTVTEQPVTKYVQTENIKPQKTEKKVDKIIQTTSQKPVKKEEFSPDKKLLDNILKITQETTPTTQHQEQKTVKNPQTSQPKQQVTQQQKPPIIQQKPVQPKTEHKNPYMTEQEEIIAWNKWRSNLQNQIMRDSNIDFAPLGTVFTFTFIVDKFGNVSNIKVECSNPNFMGVARSNVKPAISNLQRKAILNFPRGTQRTSTIVTGSFLIGTQERFSSPNDYSDYERVVH